MNPLRKAAAEYLELRRGMGFKLVGHERRLWLFVSFMEKRRAIRITAHLGLQFATRNPKLAARTMSMELSVVRAFARYQAATDPTTEVPPCDLLPSASRPAKPYLYTQSEIAQLLRAVRTSPTWTRYPGPWWHRCRTWTWYCFYGLLAVTGMRVSEVRNLRDEDIDWQEGVLTVHRSKFGKSRLVPLHSTMLRALRTFVRHRDRFFDKMEPHVIRQRLFVTCCGTRLGLSEVDRRFRRLSHRIGLRGPKDRYGPRLHDLRHRFAVETLLRWYRSGIEQVDRLLPVLSTYLGHTHVSGTYWYLRCTPELMVAAGDRLERRWEGIR